MLIVGDYRLIPVVQINNFNVYNLSGLVEGYQRLFNLIPPDMASVDFMDENVFDSQYYNYIFNNDTVFFDFMQVIMDLYYGENVFILVTQDDGYFDKITESLLRIIYTRYGYVSYTLNDPEDFTDDMLISDQTGFSIPGLQCLDVDKDRYSYLYQAQVMKQKGEI